MGSTLLLFDCTTPLPAGKYIVKIDEFGNDAKIPEYSVHLQDVKACVTDSDGDGFPDDKDAFPNDPKEWLDTDGDGSGNNADSDDDNDGMPDTWEAQHGFDSLNPADATQDADKDGFSNKQEYDAGTDPNNAKSYPVTATISSVTPNTAIVGKRLELVITGKNLTGGIDVTLSGCDDMQIRTDGVYPQLSPKSALKNAVTPPTAPPPPPGTLPPLPGVNDLVNQFIASCIPTVAGLKTGVIRDKAGSDYILKQFEVTVANVDTTPEPFPFTHQTGVALSAFISSNEITVSGINTATAISVTGGKYSINGGAYVSTAGTVSNGDKVKVQHTSSASYATKTETVVTIGGIAETFISTTKVNNAPTANAGIDQTVDSGANVTLTGSGADVDGDAITHNWVQTAGTPTVSLMGAATSSPSFTAPQVSQDTKFTFTLTVSDGKGGTITDTVDVTVKAAADTKPDLFMFTGQTGVALSSTMTSNEIMVSGINTATAIAVTGGKYSVNGGIYVSTAGTVSNGDKVKVQHTSSASYSTKTDMVLTIGGVSGTFSSTTKANSPPTANADNVTLDEDTPKTITLTGTDPEGGTLTYSIATEPKNGKVTLTNNAATYTPNPDYNGADSFTFTVSDGVATSSPATVSLTINPVEEKAADLAVKLSTSSNATPDTLTKHTVTVTNNGNVEAAGVVLDVAAPAALQDLGNGNSRSRTETVAFNLSQGAAECPLSHTGTSAVCPPLPDSVDGFALHTFNLGTIPAGQSVTVDVTNRYSGYAAGNTLQILATARTTSPGTAKDNNNGNQSFTLQAKRLLQGCDYRNLANVSPYPQTLGSRIANHFHALTFTANDSLPLTLFGYSDAGQQAMLTGNGFRWQGIETYGTYPAQLWAVAKPEVGSRHVGVAVSGGLYWSDDRMSWTAIAAYQSMALYDITHAKGRYVAVGAQGAILTSSDGLNWQQATSGTIANLAYVDYGNNEFVAGGQGVILTSPDGVVWTSRTSNAGQGDAALEHGAVWNGSQYLLFDAAGDTHILATSLDKLTAAIPFKPTVDGVVETASTRNWSAIHWQDNQYIALTTKGLLTSTDGRAWLSQAALDYPYAYQRFTDKAVIAGGYGGIWTAACAPVPTATASYFVEQKDVATKTLLESNTITVSGLTGVTTLTISGGEYRKNGGAYTKATGKVQNGDTLQVRHTTSTKSKTTVTTTLKVGSKALTFKSTTLVIDSVPDTFSFTALTGVARNTLVESGIVTLSGINVPIAISISGGEYRLNGGTYTKAKGTLKAGDTLQVRHLSSKSAKKTVTTTVTVGTAKVLFKSTTQ